MQRSAPYASTPIPVYLMAVNGPRYRTLSCVECSGEFLSRESDSFFRIGVRDLPSKAQMNEHGAIETHCGRCRQKYEVFFNLNMQVSRGNLLAYQLSQTLFLAPERIKRSRDTYCLECHHAYFSVSDRVQMISDDSVPIKNITEGLGPLEVRCKFQKCKQRWSIRV